MAEHRIEGEETFMEARLEAPMGANLGRKKVVIPIVVAIVVIASLIAGGVMLRSKSSKAAGSTGAEGGSDAADQNRNRGAAVGGKGKDGNGKEKAPVPVSVATIATAPISSYISATANLVAENEVKVLSEAEGRVASLMVEEGNLVRKGQPLVQLVRGDAEMAVAKARVRAGNAKVGYERAREIFQKGLMSQGDYEKATMEKEVAGQELAEAEWRLSKTTIRAPFDGMITLRSVTTGQHVRPGDVLFTITDFDPLVARIYLPEKDVISLKEGREVRLTLRAADQVHFAGRIRQISPVVDTATGTVKVTVEARQTPEMVRPGAFVAVDIIKATKPGATLVPREAVLRELQESHVFVEESGVAKKRPVTLGIEEGDRLEVLSGVRPGEKVIVAGQGGLKDGSPVKVLPGTAI